jgi:hypothetical protein
VTVRRTFPILAAVLLLLVSVMPVAAGKPVEGNAERHTGTDYNDGQKLPFGKGENLNGQPPIGPAKVGDTRIWLGLNDALGSIYLKTYTLRGVGEHIEVWVATNLMFPNPSMINPFTGLPFTYNDCRNTVDGGARVTITDEQVQHLISEFDTNMLPIETEWWGAAPERDGKHAILPQLFKGKHGQAGLNIPDSTYNGEGDNVVVLVDNVRDSNFYDQNNAGVQPFIAGFYFSVFDDYFDRTVMSIDAYDWVHRTTADPPHNPTADPCTSAPARPFGYEGVFAHEYQHLIHHYSDPDEVSWVNEGLSDFTEVLTGYVDLSTHVDEKGWESHTQNFLGWASVPDPSWNPIPRASGPENGLTAWGDQGDAEILTDYGFAMYFMNLVHSQGLGQEFFNAWHHQAANGIAGMTAALAAVGSSETFAGLFNDVVVSALADGYIDNGATVAGDATAADLQNLPAEATIFDSEQANGTPGAPPWGSDYIDLGSGAGLTSLTFDGADNLFPGPQWVVDPDGYFTNPDAVEDNYADNQDLSIARSVAGEDGAVLTFEHYYAMELGWDFGFVQTSSDGGLTWQSLGCEGTTSDHNPDALAHIVAHVPGYTGPSDDGSVTDTIGTALDPVEVTCPALPAGVDYLAFRLMTDPAVNFDGWHVRNIELDGVDLGTPGSLAGWDNIGFLTPINLDYGFVVVGLNGTVDAFGDVGPSTSVLVLRPTLGSGDEYTLSAGDLAALAGYGRVVAIVSGFPADETSLQYQPYSLMVNGVDMADGGP